MSVQRRERLWRFVQALEAVRLTGAFEASGLGVALLKGAVLGEVAYGGVENRGSCDIDLLVRPVELNTAGKLLETLGYRKLTESPTVLVDGRPARDGAVPNEVSFRHKVSDGLLELHPRLIPYAMAPVFDESLVWKRLERIGICGVSTPTIGTVDTLLYLAYHGLYHGWCSPRYATDFARYALAKAGEDDIEQVLRESHARGCRRMVLIAAWLAAATGEWKISNPFKRALAEDQRAETIARKYAAAMDRGPGASHQLLRLVLGMRHAWDSIPRRGRWFSRLLFAPNARDYGCIKLPGRLTGLYILVRPVRLLGAWTVNPVRRALKCH